MSCSPIETLENRRLFSIVFAHHVLTVRGSGGSADTIVVGVTPDHLDLSAHLSFAFRGKIRSYELDVPFSRGIRLINLIGGNQSDLITVDQTNGSFPVLTRIWTGNGNDTVMAGDEPDHIRMGNGIDQVSTGDGDDIVLAGRGPDTMVAGNGNDTLHAGPGHDLIVAGNGNDAFVDPFGHNSITAGAGHDLYVVKDIRLDPTNFQSSKDTWKPFPSKKNGDSAVSQIVNDVLGYLF
jgi:Ca2+-binding RTX toxin-like protein